MELEEMQQAWDRLSTRVEKQEILSTQLLEKLRKRNYHSTLNRIGNAEFIGTLVCYAGAGYISVHLAKIEDLLTQALAVLALGLLLVLPIISLASVRAIKKVNLSSATYVETIHTFARQKIRFQKLQKINVLLGLVLMLISIPVLSGIQGKTMSQIPFFWSVLLPVGMLLFVAFAYWVLKGYNKTLAEMESMLSDIDS